MKKNLLFLALALVALSASAQQNQTPASNNQQPSLHSQHCDLATSALSRFFIPCLVMQ